GFLPLATPINFLLLFIAFAINIPLAVFFLMSVLFAGLALLLDPVFATLGYEVLNTPALKETFTSMYNYAPTLWTSYNYTILMGSLLISLPLALTMFPILNRLIDKYRDVLEAKFKDSKYFS
ncbi:MAG: TIGR03546 family protein, partial [Campylobacterota bacterium]|nr:TIGR03546 family protein [Campylobacterota bacterium]